MASSARLGLIWAEAEGGVIGHDGVMPWHLPEDLAHFRTVTMGSPVIMGRKTWQSLPDRFRPLPGRRNVVVTRNREWTADGAEVVRSIEEMMDAVAELRAHNDASDVWVIGGAEIFAHTIAAADVLEVTRIGVSLPGDTYAPEIDRSWTLAAADPDDVEWHTAQSGMPYRFEQYLRVR